MIPWSISIGIISLKILAYRFMSIIPVLLYPDKILLVRQTMISLICCCERGIVRVCVKILEGSISERSFADDLSFDNDSSVCTVSVGEYGSVIICSIELSSESDDSDESWWRSDMYTYIVRFEISTEQSPKFSFSIFYYLFSGRNNSEIYGETPRAFQTSIFRLWGSQTYPYFKHLLVNSTNISNKMGIS